MTFSFKKIFKKMCVLGGTLMFMSPLVSTVANAVAPTSSTYGVKLNQTGTIAGGSISSIFDTIIMSTSAGTLTYTGAPQSLFAGVTYKKGEDAVESFPTGFEVYFRVHRQGEPEPNSYSWTKDISELKGTKKGTYDVFYYVDGGDGYEDTVSETPTPG